MAIRKHLEKFSLAYRVTVIYILFGALWILLSDKILALFIKDIQLMAFIQTIKGNLYVFITGMLLFVLILAGLKEMNKLHEETEISEAKYRRYFEQGFVGIVLISPDLEIEEINSKAQQIFGVSKARSSTMALEELLSPENLERVMEHIERIDNIQSFELVISGFQGERAHVLMSINQLIDENGKLIHHIAFVQEINELKKYQNALEALNNQLEQRVIERTHALDQSNRALKRALADQEALSNQLESSNQSLRMTVEHLNKMQEHLVEAERMTTLGNLVASLAHEVSTPLGAAKTSGNYIQEETSRISEDFKAGTLKKSEFIKYMDMLIESTDIVNRNLDNAVELMTNFKRLAVDQTQMEELRISVKALVNETLISLKPILKQKQIEFDINIHEDLMIQIVPGYLTQILNNLLTNSMRHGFRDRTRGRIKIEAELNGNIFKLIYEDDGQGIGREAKDKLFEPFFSTLNREDYDNFSGTGLGLHIVHKIVKDNLGGTIHLETEVQKFTRFTIEIEMKSSGSF